VIAIYWLSYLAIAVMGGWAAYSGDWFIVRVCVGGAAVMFLTYGPPSYFMRRASDRKATKP
jgi:hypothetical protein